MAGARLRPDGCAASVRFSHIYIEQAVGDSPLVRAVLEKFPCSRRIAVRHYKDIFARPGQDFAAQKKSPKLILAAGRPPFLYRGADVCPSFGNPAFYYASSVMNCIFNCEYCYLQGMYPSANLVVFVNIEDVFRETDRLLASALGKGRPAHDAPALYVCNSYDTDLLALRNMIPLADRWLDFASQRPDLLVEMRTKSASISWIQDREPVNNVIIAWTLSPEPVAKAFETRAPSLSARLRSAGKARDAGWRVRVCIDPILFVQGWRQVYGELIERIFRELKPEMVENASIGVFRMNRDFIKRARKVRPDSAILNYPFSLKNGIYSYPDNIVQEMLKFAGDKLSVFLPAEKIFSQEIS